MSAATLLKDESFVSYSFNKTIVPFPEIQDKKVLPPKSNSKVIDSSHLFKKKTEPLTKEKLRKKFIEDYLKAERVVVSNFYTGGSPYKSGVLDMIYKGFNPLKPAKQPI